MCGPLVVRGLTPLLQQAQASFQFQNLLHCHSCESITHDHKPLALALFYRLFFSSFSLVSEFPASSLWGIEGPRSSGQLAHNTKAVLENNASSFTVVKQRELLQPTIGSTPATGPT